MNNHLYWIGIRESELECTQRLFAGSITIFGTGQRRNRAFEREYGIRFDYNRDNSLWNQFVLDQASKIIQEDPNCQFILYDAIESCLYGSIIERHAICQNPFPLLELLSNKIQTRQWLSDQIPILPYWIGRGSEISRENLRKSFPSTATFVLQQSQSCGGSGTWLLTENNWAKTLAQIEPQAKYAISPYQRNSISPNIHIVVFSQTVLLLPPSVQLLEPNEYGFTYKGADFPAYNSLPQYVDDQIRVYAQQIGERLRLSGYRGICGIDFLISDGKLYLMEINARFQSSTFLLNRAMKAAGLNTSMQALHIMACQHGTPPKILETLKVPYSFYHYSYEETEVNKLCYLHDLLKTSPKFDCVDDGLDWHIRMEPGTYLFKAVFEQSISAVGPEGELRKNGNVALARPNAFSISEKHDLMCLKFMLLAHGTRLSTDAMHRLIEHGGFNHEEFDALDLTLNQQICVCAPYNTSLSQMSPFCVEAIPSGGYILSYYGTKVTNVNVRAMDKLGEKRTDSGILYHDFTYLSNDRLRVFQRLGCYFKDCGLGCQFCDIPRDERKLTLSDIYQAIDDYKGHPRVRHYLIGGGSNPIDDDFQFVIQIAKHIRNTTGKPIYLMSLPPQKVEILHELKDSGITQVAFNMELFDRKIAQQLMPGKGRIPFETYALAFQEAVKLWGSTGDVRTIFVVGLEPTKSLMKGIDYASSHGVAPILSLFRPAEGTKLQSALPPCDEEIMEIYYQAYSICHQHGMHLGPACPYCQDNCITINL